MMKRDSFEGEGMAGAANQASSSIDQILGAQALILRHFRAGWRKSH
jgi:hypothetical protein